MRKLLILLAFLLAFTVQAQEEEQEDIPYLRLGSNFAVPELPNWEHEVVGETALFSNETLNAQIYVAVYDMQDVEMAIILAANFLQDGEFFSTGYRNRIGRGDGTWEYRLFNVADRNISAYGMLKSGRVYVVAFAENSPDYAAYHLAFRSSIGDAQGTDIRQVVDEASLLAIQAAINPDFAGAIQNVSNPNPDNQSWVLAEYEEGIATASYLNDNIVYVSLVVGDSSLAPQLSNAFDTVFLGFVITPDNGEYLLLGMGFAAAIMLTLLASFWLRYRNLQKDLETIQQLAED